MTSPVMARLMEAAATLRELRISRKECVSCGRSLAHRSDYKPGEECQRCEEDMPLPPMDDMDEDDLFQTEMMGSETVPAPALGEAA